MKLNFRPYFPVELYIILMTKNEKKQEILDLIHSIKKNKLKKKNLITISNLFNHVAMSQNVEFYINSYNKKYEIEASTFINHVPYIHLLESSDKIPFANCRVDTIENFCTDMYNKIIRWNYKAVKIISQKHKINKL
jgi:pectin methylesterase-like acyl-CoA thioesterase